MGNPTTSTKGILGASQARPFELIRRAPADDLADYIERHWVVRWSVRPGTSFTQELLPHPCVNLVSAPDGVAVHGMPLQKDRRRLEGAGVAIGTKFRPGAFRAFVDVPARRLVNESFGLPELLGSDGRRLQQRLAWFAADTPKYIACVEGFFRRRLPAPDPRRELLLAIVADMLAEHSSLTVAALADRHGVSQRTLQRLFREYVGVGPKWVLKRYRTHEAAERIASGEASDAARLAAELGYFDQSHFVREFTAQVGCSPGRYAELCSGATPTDTARAA